MVYYGFYYNKKKVLYLTISSVLHLQHTSRMFSVAASIHEYNSFVDFEVMCSYLVCVPVLRCCGAKHGNSDRS